MTCGNLNAIFSYADQIITVWTAKCQGQAAVLAALSIQSDTGRIETCQHFPGGRLDDKPSPIGFMRFMIGIDWVYHVYHRGIGLMSSWGRDKTTQSWKWYEFSAWFLPLKSTWSMKSWSRAVGSLLLLGLFLVVPPADFPEVCFQVARIEDLHLQSATCWGSPCAQIAWFQNLTAALENPLGKIWDGKLLTKTHNSHVPRLSLYRTCAPGDQR